MRCNLNRFRLLIVLLAFGFSASTCWADDKPDVEKELKKFQGTWTVESVEAGGTKLPADLFKEMTVIFEGAKYTVKIGDMVIQTATIKLDPSKSPKTFDSEVTQGPNKGTILSIYEINGDTMKACFDPEGKKRPTEFKTEAGSQNTLAVYKRAKK